MKTLDDVLRIPNERVTLKQQAIDRLRQAILESRFEAGERLVERTLGDAMFSAHDEMQEPLYGIIGKVRRNVSLGVAFPDSFQEVADRYAVKELQILALGIRVNAQYGGNMSDLLANIIRFINEREKLAGQLRAMTGETRISAGVLAVVPIAIASYILFMNPTYLTSMWHDPSGRHWILFALGLQVSGVFVIWRMMRSI